MLMELNDMNLHLDEELHKDFERIDHDLHDYDMRINDEPKRNLSTLETYLIQVKSAHFGMFM